MPVHDASIDLPDDAIIELLVPVVAQLLLPHEVLDACDLFIVQLLNDVSVMDILCNQGNNTLTLEACQLVPDQLSETLELVFVFLQPLAHCLDDLTSFLDAENLLRLKCPIN